MQSAKHLRSLLLRRRRQIAPDTYRMRNQQLASHSLHLLSAQHAQGTCCALHTFLPIHNNAEPDTEPMYQWAWAHELPVYTTRIEADNTLVHVLLAPASQLACGRWHIPTLPAAQPLAAEALPDPLVVLVPLLAFDRQGHRLGYGKGYYDALLHELHARASVLAIGLSLAAPMECLPTVHAQDHKLQACVTPFGMYWFA